MKVSHFSICTDVIVGNTTGINHGISIFDCRGGNHHGIPYFDDRRYIAGCCSKSWTAFHHVKQN